MSDHTLTTIISAASALAAVAAAVAAIWSAKLARDAAGQSSRQAREAILCSLSQSVATVVSRGDRIKSLITRLKLARETGFALNGRNVSAAAPLLQADEEKSNSAGQMRTEAHALEMRGLEKCGDAELQSCARNMASYAARLGIMELDLDGELERVEAENRDARMRNHQRLPLP